MDNTTSGAEITAAGIDIFDFFRIIRRRLLYVVAVFSIIVAITVFMTFTTVPVYNSGTTVLISQDSTKMSLEDMFAIDSTTSSSFNTRISLIKSKKLAYEVWETLRNDDKLSIDLNTPRAILGAIEAVPRRNTRIVTISVSSIVPEAAALYANTVADTFINWSTDEVLKSTSFYTKQLGILEKQIGDINGQINKFVGEHGLVTPEMWATYRSEYSSLRALVTSKEKQVRSIERQLKEIEQVRGDGGNYAQLFFLKKSPVFMELWKSRIELERKISLAERVFGPKHPNMVALVAELETMKSDITQVAQGLVDDYLYEAKAELLELADLKNELKQKESSTEGLLALLQKYTKLERELQASQSLYDIVLQKARESGMTASSGIEPTQVIDRATVPAIPASPNIKLNLALGIILGLILAIGFAYLLDYLDDSIKTASEIDLVTRADGVYPAIPTLGYIPKISADGGLPAKICVIEPKSASAEAFRTLRTGVVFSFTETGSKAILISSALSSEGKTICVSNLATMLAQNNFRTILVDADMRKPRVHSIFGLPSEIGLSSYLIAKTGLSDVILETDIQNLSVIPSGPIPPLPNELLSSNRFEQMIKELKETFDYIIIDSPPGIVADALVMSPFVDGLSIIVKSGRTSRRCLKGFIEQLRRANSKILGVILNDADSKMNYGYYYSYKSKYGYYAYGSSKRHDSKTHKAASL